MARIKRTAQKPPQTQPAWKQPEKQPQSMAPLPALATAGAQGFVASTEETQQFIP